MIPQGPIYQSIRTAVLTAFADRSEASLKKRVTFGDWLLNQLGTYHVKSVGTKDFTIEASQFDISSALLTDVECLTNHCFEQLQELSRYYVDNEPRSDAWNVVTIYYFSFFAAQSFLTLIGSPVIFIDKAHIANIRSLALGTVPNPGAGTYYIHAKTAVSATSAEYQIKRSDLKIHDAVWKKVFDFFSSVLKAPNVSSLTQEVLFYQLLTSKVLQAVYKTESWPSSVRIKANYSPGFAYLLVENADAAKTKNLLTHWQNADEKTVLNNLKAAVAANSGGSKSDFAGHVRLLHDITQPLFYLTRLLYSELLERKNISKTWEHRRHVFRQRMSLPAGNFSTLAQTF